MTRVTEGGESAPIHTSFWNWSKGKSEKTKQRFGKATWDQKPSTVKIQEVKTLNKFPEKTPNKLNVPWALPGRADHPGTSYSPSSQQKLHCIEYLFQHSRLYSCRGRGWGKTPTLPQEPYSEQPCISHPLLYKKQATATPQ